MTSVDKVPSETLNPSFRQEDQDTVQELQEQPEIIGPAAYASPDPETARGRLVPVETHPLELSEDYGGSVPTPAETVTLQPGFEEEGAGGSVIDVSEYDDDTTKADWQKAAKSRGLSTSGSVAKIKARIEKHDEEGATRDEEDKSIRAMSREDMDKSAAEFDIDPEQYSTKELLAEAVIAASHGEEVPAGDKAPADEDES